MLRNIETSSLENAHNERPKINHVGVYKFLTCNFMSS